MMNIIVLFGMVGILLNGCATYPPLPTVEGVDLVRYEGTWIEIARYENRFERGCVGASAEYLIEDEHLRVINRCFDANGTMIAHAQGKAYPTDLSSRLKVTFFWPFYGDYHILMLGDGYHYSVVGEPTRRYLWILSRTPELDPRDREAIVGALARFGYDPRALYWTTIRP